MAHYHHTKLAVKRTSENWAESQARSAALAPANNGSGSGWDGCGSGSTSPATPPAVGFCESLALIPVSEARMSAPAAAAAPVARNVRRKPTTNMAWKNMKKKANSWNPRSRC